MYHANEWEDEREEIQQEPSRTTKADVEKLLAEIRDSRKDTFEKYFKELNSHETFRERWNRERKEFLLIIFVIFVFVMIVTILS
ncbi:MAG: hypothetical protein QY317_16565 [Candidatus Jettenia caeni]|nr:MAG: hypothetical protein QY317_16565 [Candidatus Jettenia caeni]